MRGWRLAIGILALATVVAGCIGTSDDALDEASVAEQLENDQVEVPEDATVEEIEEGVRLVFEDVQLPLEQEIEIPNGTEMVRIEARAASETAVLPVAYHAESDALRCLPALRQAWNVGYGSTTGCAGLTALDPKPATWTVGVYGGGYDWLVSAGGLGLVGEYEPATAEVVHVDLIEEAGGGPIEDVDTSKLSKPHHEIGETTNHTVTSHDGADLFVQVTTPAGGHGSYPTLLISSPYTTGDHASGGPAYEDVVKDWVPRGYAVVVADVRGFARSDGCVEVWGPNEQADQAVLVDWITDQDFSDGHVGMYGVSYPGTTPVEAAVQAPEGLDAIVSTAGVLNAYRDWHFGGVPNGENIGSPVFYQELGTQTTSPDPLERALDTANGVCDPTLAARANDPRSVYDEYYVSRNLTQRADQVQAAVMIEHAYEDPNVKSSMQMGWFNDLDVPKLGLLGHWSHQPAARADEVTLRHAWMDQFVMGKELGLGNVSEASISANGDRYREAPAWPDPTVDEQPLWPHFDEGELVAKPGQGSAELLLTGTQALEPVGQAPGDVVTDTMVGLTTRLQEPFSLAGAGTIHLDVTLEGAQNAYVGAFLYDVGDEDVPKLVTFGWANLAHRGTHDSYEPIEPGERVDVPLPLLPTEHTFEEGETMRLELRGVTEGSWGRYKPGKPGQLVLHGGEDGTLVELPRLPSDAYEPVPTSVATAGPS